MYAWSLCFEPFVNQENNAAATAADGNNNNNLLPAVGSRQKWVNVCAIKPKTFYTCILGLGQPKKPFLGGQ